MHMRLVLIISDINASSRHTNVWNLLAVKLAVNILSADVWTEANSAIPQADPRPLASSTHTFLSRDTSCFVCSVQQLCTGARVTLSLQ
jgi:hypothetical protein